MYKLEIIFCSVILCSMLPHCEGSILGNGIFDDFEKNKKSQVKIIPAKKIHSLKDVTSDPTKGMSIVISPVIHNVAQSYGPGVDKVTEVSTTPPVIITHPPHIILMANSICTIFKKELNSVIKYVKVLYSLTTFLLNSMFIKMEGLLWGLIRYIICRFVPICGFFTVFGDEVNGASLDLAEDSISRGLDFVEDMMEYYHSAQNGTNYLVN